MSAGAPAAIVRTLQDYAASGTIAAAACAALANLLQGIGDVFNVALKYAVLRDAICTVKGVDAVAKALLRMQHPDRALALEGCRALLLLAWTDSDDVATAYGVAAVCHAMMWHREDDEVIVLACRALARVAAGSNACKDRVIAQGGPSQIMMALQAHAETPASNTLRQEASTVLRCLIAGTVEHQRAVIRVGGAAILEQHERDALQHVGPPV